MKMTTLGMTKEEMIYQFIISLNKGGYASGVYAGEVVAKAIGEYDALVEKDIIKEIAYVEPGKPTNDLRARICKPTVLEDNEEMVWDLSKGKFVYPEELSEHWHYTKE